MSTHEQDSDRNVRVRLAIMTKLRIVIRAAQQHSTGIEKRCGVSGAQLWIMQELHDAAALRVGELAGRLAIHQSTASNLLDELVKKDYVVKSRDPLDQRAVRVQLSVAGAALLAAAPQPVRGLLPGALTRLDGSSLHQLNASLQSLLDSIEGMDESIGMLPLSFTM